jgi:hypothetical protein
MAHDKLGNRMRTFWFFLIFTLAGPPVLRAESVVSDKIPGLQPQSKQLLEKILNEHEKATGERIQIRLAESEGEIAPPEQNEAAGAWVLWIHPQKQTLKIQSDVSAASILSDDAKRQIATEVFSSTLRARGMDAAIRLSVQGLLERLRSPLATSGRLQDLTLVQPGEGPSLGIEPVQVPLGISLLALALAWVTLFFLARVLFSTEIELSIEGVRSLPPLRLFFEEMRAVAQERKLDTTQDFGGIDGAA